MLTMTFGKHKGKDLSKIALSYLRWLVEELQEAGSSPKLERQLTDYLWFVGKFSKRPATFEEITEAKRAEVAAQFEAEAEPGLIGNAIKEWSRRQLMKNHPDRGGSVACSQAVADAIDDLKVELSKRGIRVES